ncbi:MAG: collagen-like protein, partial [Myxococcota bacterium]|nr:collagen-like protein [Myxococcota bacterium]
MHRRLASILIPFLLLVAGSALAVPTQLSQQGRLLDGEGEPLDEVHSLTFSLYDAETEGEVLWTETHEVAFERGYYSVTLGSEEPLDDLLFAGDPVWLELSVDEEPLSPRQSVVSVPYALRA